MKKILLLFFIFGVFPLSGRAQLTQVVMAKSIRLIGVRESVVLDAENPKRSSAYYNVARASNGYAVVFPGREFVNIPPAENFYIVLEKENMSISSSGERVLLIATQNIRTGRRYVKNVDSITIGRAQ